jgi:RNA polymerase sigma-70 factor (ECF subfamily)
MVADADILFAAHREGVFRYLCRIVGSGDARELTQEVFLRVSRGPVPNADDSGRRAWVFSIARNLALNHVRDGRRHGVAVELSETAGPPTQELAAALREALDRLASLDRDVFLMREAGGLSYDEISTACDLTVNAVRSRLHRARQQLRLALGPALGSAQTVRGVRLYDRPGSRSTR